MVRTQIQLTDEQADAITKIAKSRRISIAEVIRQAVNNTIKTNTVDAAELCRRSIEVTGKYRSGKRDVSGEHDKYLAELLAE